MSSTPTRGKAQDRRFVGPALGNSPAAATREQAEDLNCYGQRARMCECLGYVSSVDDPLFPGRTGHTMVEEAREREGDWLGAKWASRNSMGSGDPREPEHPSPATSSKTTSQTQYQSPGAKHTLVRFLDTPAIPSAGQSAHGGVRLNLQRRAEPQQPEA
ncbi:hypothetical protein BS47DRAFT_1397136 [Hydnum rufescens UP504]|uniref:Uncharacterized protein n=1 Tax=Hydnum rufescens UP504 TaxID=1448309 RepID=A0A9P6DS52_9AGAM|nr:hypothetical protein BS47DRAFT_1397136 [Hydnum rufescens UP504]